MEELYYHYKATVLKVVDGDTVHLYVDKGTDDFKTMIIRLYGINTQELHDPDPVKRALAVEAKDFVQKSLPVGMQVYIKTYKDRTEKYGRYLAEIFTDPEQQSTTINQQLINLGLAVPYFGGAKITVDYVGGKE